MNISYNEYQKALEKVIKYRKQLFNEHERIDNEIKAVIPIEITLGTPLESVMTARTFHRIKEMVFPDYRWYNSEPCPVINLTHILNKTAADFKKVRHLGEKSLNEIREIFNAYGLILK